MKQTYKQKLFDQYLLSNVLVILILSYDKCNNVQHMTDAFVTKYVLCILTCLLVAKLSIKELKSQEDCKKEV